MIGMVGDEDARAPLAAIAENTQRHLQRHLHAGGARVRIEHMLKPRWRDLDQSPRQVLGRGVGPAGEDELIEA